MLLCFNSAARKAGGKLSSMLAVLSLVKGKPVDGELDDETRLGV